jgi:hypothetical protein
MAHPGRLAMTKFEGGWINRIRTISPCRRDKWEAMLIENCRRFAAGQPLLNIVAPRPRANQPGRH